MSLTFKINEWVQMYNSETLFYELIVETIFSPENDFE